MHVSIVQYFVQPTLTLSMSDIFERATWQPYSHFQWQLQATLTNHRLTVSSRSKYIVGRDGALVEAITLNRRVVGSTPALAVT